MEASTETVHLSLQDLQALVVRVLEHHGLASAHAQATARVIVAGERDACASHGLYRLLTAVATLRGGGVCLDAQPSVSPSAAGIVLVEAHRGFSHLALETGLKPLLTKARDHGLAAMAVRNCFHFTALWPEVEAVAAEGFACVAMTISKAWVAPVGGATPVLGTNPFAFAWPRKAKPPYVFDFATSVAARGDIELHERQARPIPQGWGVDSAGEPCTNAAKVLHEGAMLAFGGHKGSALATMIELLAGPLIGQLTSLDTLAAGGAPGAAPCHGELLIAFCPERFGFDDSPQSAQRAETLFDGITGQGARLPSQRRFEARARSVENGVDISASLLREVLALLH